MHSNPIQFCFLDLFVNKHEFLPCFMVDSSESIYIFWVVSYLQICRELSGERKGGLSVVC